MELIIYDKNTNKINSVLDVLNTNDIRLKENVFKSHRYCTLLV